MPKVQKNKRSRGFSITYFGEHRPERLPFMRYLCTQQEKAPSTERLHWQTYIYVDEPMSLSAIKKSCELKGAHIEVAKGTPQQNILYCSKQDTAVPGTFYESGIRPSQGERTDLKQACIEVKSGGLRNVKSDEAIVRYGRGLSLLQSVRRVVQPELKEVIWIHGPTGVGKTRYVYENSTDLYHQTSSDGWFDGYFGQKEILIDDYSSSAFQVRDILQLFDRYNYDLKIKGSFQKCEAKKIFVTSHFPPEHYFSLDRWPEISRRISKIICMAESSITSATSVEFSMDEKKLNFVQPKN